MADHSDATERLILTLNRNTAAQKKMHAEMMSQLDVLTAALNRFVDFYNGERANDYGHGRPN
jgi:pyrroloquinoline quinone (PQQ) biosynthesis protein C